MGNIKTKKRNRMHTQKLRDLAFLQLELRHQQARSGKVYQRLKRSFGNASTSSTASPRIISPEDVAIAGEAGDELAADADSESSDEELSDATPAKSTSSHSVSSGSFATLMKTYEVDDDSDEEDLHHAPIPQTPNQPSVPKVVRVYFGQQRHIPIRSLFNWDIEVGWDQFWFDGVKNLRQEMEFYDLIARSEDAVEGEMNEEAEQPSSGGSRSHPVIIDAQ